MTPNTRTCAAICFILAGAAGCSGQRTTTSDNTSTPFTIIAIGDAGETGRPLRSNAFQINAMSNAEHDAGRFHAMIFLGDNFYNTGLNVPRKDVDGLVKDVLGRFSPTFEKLGRAHVHAIAGNHDWYLRNAIETSFFFGLFDIKEAPIGLTDRGNIRARTLPHWTYYFNMPAHVFYPLVPSSQDSVQLLFFDSALLLRTDPSQWRRALDSLGNLLRSTSDRPGVKWRILSVHHPFYSLGPHGGYRLWDDESNSVEYLTSCDKDTNAVGWFKNWIDPQDICAEKYQQYIDSVRAVIHNSGVKVQILLAGHDHSLQLLYYPGRNADCEACPSVHIVSGAGALPSLVRFPAPPFEYTSAQTDPGKRGLSVPGFAQLRFEMNSLRVVFFDGVSGDPIDMGGGRKEFWISPDGRLLE